MFISCFQLPFVCFTVALRIDHDTSQAVIPDISVSSRRFCWETQNMYSVLGSFKTHSYMFNEFGLSNFPICKRVLAKWLTWFPRTGDAGLRSY